jgi:hypothetical protein
MHFLLFFLMFPFFVSASPVSGRVTDMRTGQPLAFVHVYDNETKQGTLTDINGLFSLEVSPGTHTLQFSYVGYQKVNFPVDMDTFLHIEMLASPVELREVVVVPGVNPAHRIIQNAINHRDVNNPDRLRSYSYNSYNRFIATLDRDYYEERWETLRDTTSLRYMRMLDRRHIFIMESVTQRKFLAPDRSNEVVIANRISGLQNPIFAMLASELQPFSFYSATIKLLDNEFLSPLNRVAFSRYFYNLRDTLYQGNDSVFVIEFRPSRGAIFNALTGLMYIHSDKWALQNVIAQPAREVIGGLSFRIQQQYYRPDGVHWFPLQLNTDVDFFNPDASTATGGLPVRMIGRSYITDVEINPPLRPGEFTNYTVDFDPGAAKEGNQYWNQYRVDTLTAKEITTYRLMDSLGQVMRFDKLVQWATPLFFGELPLGMFNLPLNTLYRYNDFERHRPGIGLKTNHKFSGYFSLGGQIAYGTGDNEFKYGYHGDVLLNKQKQIRVGGRYSFDVWERGGTQLLQQNFLISAGFIRNIRLHRMDYTRSAGAYLKFLAWRGFIQGEWSANTGRTYWTDLYYFVPDHGSDGIRSFRFTESTLKLRIAYGETLMNTPLRIVRFPSHQPVFYFNITRGFDNLMQGEIEYTRIESRAEYKYSIPFVGRQTWVADAGWIDREDLPWAILFSAKAGNRDLLVASPISFGTMKMNEFAAGRYAAVFFQHSFQNLLFKWPRYEPELVLVSHAGIGKLSQPDRHILMEARSWDKGYFESGFMINSILPRHWVRRVVKGITPGVEVLYRYGPYRLPDPWENLTVKLNLVTGF